MKIILRIPIGRNGIRNFNSLASEACAAVQLLDGVGEGEASNPRIYAPLELKSGESRLYSVILALTPQRSQLHRELGILYQHTPLEWINVTSAFWKERLGTICSGIRENQEMGRKYSDMQIRFILDNFNCLSFNENESCLPTGRALRLIPSPGSGGLILSQMW